jgi:non-homologous end joining protein Ku
MAAQLFGEMTGTWKSDVCSDKFDHASLALVSKKFEAGETTTVTTLEEAPSGAESSNIVDLTDDGTRSAAAGAKKSEAKTPPRRRA